MKTIKVMLSLCMLAHITNAQPYTAQTFYGHNGTNATLSSGTYVNSIPGFIMAGYLPGTSSTAGKFLIDKVRWDGTFTGSSTFSSEYFVYDASSGCNGTPIQETNCYGVSVIESNGGALSNIRYAFTAAFNRGLVFANMNIGGAIVNSSFFRFPTNASPNCKPLITLAASGGYYICGSYILSSTEYIYIIRLSGNGTGIWSQIYDLGANVIFTPHGIVEDNYPTYDELAIAGTVGTSSTDGFIMTVDESTGSVLFAEAIGSGSSSNESLSSLALAANNGGYIVGGRTNVNQGNGEAWMMNLNANGSVNWSKRITPSTNSNAGNVVGVIERYSTAYGSFEYYGATVSSGSGGGMLVLKLDQFGAVFSKPGNTNSEFLYNDGSGTNVASPAAISFLDAGSSNNNTGIHVFGNDQSSPSRFFLNQACFNGATGNCGGTGRQFLTTISSISSGPQSLYTFGCNTNSGLSQCNNYRIVPNTVSYNPNQPCSATILPQVSLGDPYDGDNSRPAAPTGVAENNGENITVSIFPNPTNSIAEIKYANNKVGKVEITLTDLMGRTIKTLDSGVKNTGINILSVDLNSLNLETGVYFINVTTSETKTQEKIIFNKN